MVNLPNKDKFQELDVEELENMANSALGLRLLVQCEEATYIGVFNDILPQCEQLILEQALIATTGKKCCGFVIVFYSEISSIHLLGLDPSARRRLTKLVYGDKGIAKASKRILPPSLNEETGNADEGGDLLPQFKKSLLKNIPWTIIDKFGAEFEEFEKLCESERVFCLFGCGSSVGRRGSLAWLGVEVQDRVFLLDVVSLGEKELFNSSLGLVLRDPKKTKVVHNARRLEDFFHHKHSVDVENVFDTQAADIYVRALDKAADDVPYLTHNLSSLLQLYLNLPQSEARNLFPSIDDESLWLERPLAHELIVYLVHSVVFLRSLRDAMMDRINHDLNALMDTFRLSIRNKPFAQQDCFDDQITPPEVQKLYKQVISPTFSSKCIAYSGK